MKGSPPKTALSVRGTGPPKPIPGIGEEGAFSPQARMRYVPLPKAYDRRRDVGRRFGGNQYQGAPRTCVASPPLCIANTVRMRVSAHCADAFLNVSLSGFYRTVVRRLRPVRRQRTLCGIRIKSFGTLFVSAPLCGDSDLCDPDRIQSAVVGCLDVWVFSSIFDESNVRDLTNFNPVLTIIYRPIAYEHRPTRGRSTACLLYTSPSPRD